MPIILERRQAVVAEMYVSCRPDMCLFHIYMAGIGGLNICLLYQPMIDEDGASCLLVCSSKEKVSKVLTYIDEIEWQDCEP